jgi:hypothetical protein
MADSGKLLYATQKYEKHEHIGFSQDFLRFKAESIECFIEDQAYDLAPPPPSPVSKLEKEDGERETPC